MDALGDGLIQFGAILAIAVIAIVVFAVCAAGTSAGRAFLPRTITDVVSKLLPGRIITDVAAPGLGEFQVEVQGKGQSRTVHVRRRDGMTIAWTYDVTASFPQSGTFAITALQHNLTPKSAVAPENFKARVQQALTDVLEPKRFQPAPPEIANMWITVFLAIEDEVTLETLSEAFNQPDGHEWGTALRTALQYDSVGDVATLARGSLVLNVVDSRSAKVLWHAAAMADIVVDVTQEERERRTRKAITEMLLWFPRPNSISNVL